MTAVRQKGRSVCATIDQAFRGAGVQVPYKPGRNLVSNPAGHGLCGCRSIRRTCARHLNSRSAESQAVYSPAAGPSRSTTRLASFGTLRSPGSTVKPPSRELERPFEKKTLDQERSDGEIRNENSLISLP